MSDILFPFKAICNIEKPTPIAVTDIAPAMINSIIVKPFFLLEKFFI